MNKILLTFFFIFFFTLPLFAQVDTAWTRRYNGPGNDEDCPIDLVVDDSGNVYVTGRSYSSETKYDYATIKYYPNGDTGWVRRYNGPGDDNDEAFAIVTGPLGNLYVTGYCYVDSITQTDYATIKYYPNGDTAWIRRYNGPDSNSDIAVAVTVDASGNVYISGYSFYDSTNADYLTVKYDSNGNQLMVMRYNGTGTYPDWCRAMTLDGFGNIYVTGTSYDWNTFKDYATVKYYPNGDTAWVRRYNGPGDTYDQALDVAVDDSGSVYVTGTTGTVKYDAHGTEEWIGAWGGQKMILDDSGNIYVTGIGSHHVTAKYYPNGDTAWVRDDACNITLDGSGNVYVTGYSFLGGWTDYLTIKYNPAGDTVWTKRYNGPEGKSDDACAIALDNSGNVYVTGLSVGTGTWYDYATIKYLQFWRGDADGDSLVIVSDVIYLINYLFKGGPAPDPIQAGDANCDGQVTVSDVIYLINYLFKGRPPPGC